MGFLSGMYSVFAAVMHHVFWGVVVMWAAIRLENGLVQLGRGVAFHGQVTSGKPKKEEPDEQTKKKDPLS